MVDTGATLSAIPADILRELGIQVRRTDNARLADGTRMPVEIGGATIRVEGVTISNDVIFAQPGSPSLLGVVALETADLGVDPLQDIWYPPNCSGTDVRKLRYSG